MFDKIALAIANIGGLNWGSIGIFGFVYTLVGLSALWCISLLFRDWHRSPSHM